MISPYCPIKCFTVKGFKSLQNVTITFTNPLFLVGKNGAGKSNILKALSFLSACAASPLEDVFRTYGGIETVRYRGGGSSRPNNIFLRVDFALDNKKECYYQLEIIASKKYPFSVKREDCVIGEWKFFRPYNRKIEIHPENVVSKDFIPTVTHQTLYLPLLSGIQKFNIIKQLLSNIQNFSINPSIAQDFQRPNTSMSLTSNGSNLTSIIDSMDKASLDRVCEYLGVLVPGIVSVKAKRHGKQLMVEFCQVGKNKKGVWHEAHVMSDGTMRLLGILTIFMQNNKPKVVCIEEPEATVHPGFFQLCWT